MKTLTYCLKCGRGCKKSEINPLTGGDCYNCTPRERRALHPEFDAVLERVQQGELTAEQAKVYLSRNPWVRPVNSK